MPKAKQKRKARESVKPASDEDRARTGIPGLDDALMGGIPKENLVLISGGAGTGKTTFCLQYIVNGALKGEKGLYISTEQTPTNLQRQATQYGWDLDALQKQGLIKLIFIDILNEKSYTTKMEDSISGFRPKRVVIDSLSTFSDYAAMTDFSKVILLQRGGMQGSAAERTMPESLSEKTLVKRMLASILAILRTHEATFMLTSELPEKGDSLSSDGISEFLVDGVILLFHLGVGSAEFRTAQIRKMRYSNHRKDYLPYEISGKGIEIVKEQVL